MQPLQIHGTAPSEQSHKGFELMPRHPELVFIKSGGDIFVRMRVYVRVDTHRDIGPHPQGSCETVHHLYLLKRFAVEGTYSEPQGLRYLPVAFPYPGKHDVFRTETAPVSMQDLIPAHTVRTESV